MKITLADALTISDKAWEADNDGKLSGVTRADIWQLIEAIRERDKIIRSVLEDALSALFFHASYKTQLWAVIEEIRPMPDNEEYEEYISHLYEELYPAEASDEANK